jgi:PAS domain S-box-containing protein
MGHDFQVPEQAAGESAKLHDKKNHFEELVASVEDYAIFTMDPQGVILDWNLGAARMKGYTAAEIVGKNFSTFYPPEIQADGLPTRELEIAGTVGRFADEGWRVRKDGTRLWASITLTSIRGAEGELLGFLKITRDLTERMRTTETLRQSEERLRLLIESVQTYAIFMLDPEGHVLSWNPGARRIKGYETSEILGKHFSIFYPEDAIAVGAPETLLRRALKEGRAEHEGWRVRRDGSRFWGNVVITALYDAPGELRGFAKITRDLTDRKEFQDMQESARRKDAFLATLAHELRNPLAPMLPALQLILNSDLEPATVKKMVGVLERQVEQMSFLIEELMDVSRLNAGKITLKKSRGPLAEVIWKAVEAAQPAADAMGQMLTVTIADPSLEIEADRHRLTQVISNLLSNAVRYTARGGRIDLETSLEFASTLRISVRDNGKGIASALQAKIFEMFDQGTGGAEEGLGIGLTVVKQLVEMHGGTVGVHSEGEGKGSEFTILLPLPAASAQPDAAVNAAPAAGHQRPACTRVLIADDGKAAADILAMFFQMEGMETAVAYDGLEAVELAKSFHPHLVIMDLGMPRMDGYEAARLIRPLMPEGVIAALSGWGGPDDRHRSAEAGFDLHLVKPVVPADLRKLLGECFGG